MRQFRRCLEVACGSAARCTEGLCPSGSERPAPTSPVLVAQAEPARPARTPIVCLCPGSRWLPAHAQQGAKPLFKPTSVRPIWTALAVALLAALYKASPYEHNGSRPGKLRRYSVGALVISLLFLTLPGVKFQAYATTEYEVEAAYLYNLGLFVRWPATPGGNPLFPICVIGMDPFGKVLDTAVAGETIQGKNVIARRVANPEQALGCRILFISSSEETDLKQILITIGKNNVLTVSDMPEFAARGGIIHFVTENSRVRFEINLAAAEHAGLSLSSQLLKLAIRVEGASGLGANR
jgi:YfiR/HmsC-like